MTDNAILELSSKLARTSDKEAALYNLPITIRNASSVGFTKAEVAVKDEGSGQVATAYFGYIASQSTAQEFVRLPGGIESCLYRITPEVGDDLLGGGLANNAPGVNITVTD